MSSMFRRVAVTAFFLSGAVALGVAYAGPAHAPPRGANTVDAGPAKPAPPEPDPPPLVSRAQWIFDLRWSRGEVYLLAVHKVELPAPQATPRAIGRFALELHEGKTLVERVRFDFPMLGGVPESDAGPSLTRFLTTRIGVMFPVTRRGTRLELVDRSTGQRWNMPWPPHETAQRGDAGLAAAKGG